MKSKIGFIGIGQCGGNITNLFQKNGFKTFYINTSLEDISTLKVDNFYHIPEANGSNHNRNKAINYIKNHYQNITNQINKIFQMQDIIFLVFSTGGGTGSGISPLLLDILAQQSNKTFGAVCVLPNMNESINIQANSYQCMIQLSNLKNIGSVFVLDNSKNNRQKINIQFYKLFNELINIPKHISRKGNIDNAEIIEFLTIRGVSTITTTENNNVSNIINSLENSCFIYEKDKKLIYSAISLKSDIDMSGLMDYIGKPYDIFTNYNDRHNVFCFSGMSFPETRLRTIKNLIESRKQEVNSIVDNSKNNSIKNELQWNVSLRDGIVEELEINEVFKKYQ